MENVLFFLFAFNIFLNSEDYVSSQRMYDIEFGRYGTSLNEGEIFEIYLLEVEVLSNGKKSVVANFTVLKDFTEEATIECELVIKVKKNAKWVNSMLRFKRMNCCKMFQSDKYLVPVVFQHVGFPKKCPIKKGNYGTKEPLVIDENMLPPILPGSVLKLEWNVFDENKKNFAAWIEVTINREKMYKLG